MHPSRIAELLEPFLGKTSDRSKPALSEAKGPTTSDLHHISTYIDLLRRWNARINLTAIRNEEEIVTRHFGESLFAARHLFPTREAAPAPPQPSVIPNRSEGSVRNPLSHAQPQTSKPITAADVGSGAGFPGIPIKLWTPDLHITLIESNHKKAAFLREVTRVLTLTDINIQTTRAEALPQSQFDLVTLRAVERFDQVLPTAASLVAPGGRLALLISAAQLPQAQKLAPTLAWQAPIPIPQSQSRILLQATRTTLDKTQEST